MKTITFNTSSDFNLVYEINDTNTATNWLDVISRCTIEKMLYRNENYLHGFADDNLYEYNCLRLSALIKLIDLEIDYPITNDVLNSLHTHFVTPGRGAPYDVTKVTKSQLMEINLLIHWLEYEQANRIHDRNQCLINLDFNHHSRAFADYRVIDTNELHYFSPDMEFGSLHLHYSHIGRHFLEMFDANDIIAPRSHYIAHTSHNATCGLVFSEPQDNVLRKTQMLDYYNSRGGMKFWGVEFSDNRLRNGFFQLGTLKNFDTSDATIRDYIRKQIAINEITYWEIST